MHDGPPSDSGAQNYYVKYKDYIKNVASSEIYATWPEATLLANILAIQSITYVSQHLPNSRAVQAVLL